MLGETRYSDNGVKLDSQFYLWLDSLPLGGISLTYDAQGAIASSSAFYLHADHLNTPRLATNQSGNEVWRWKSDAFGVGGAAGTATINLRFPGQYYDGESELHYNYFRDYDPETGRYVESDPIGLAGGLNTYGYVEGNPVNYIDPTGENAVAGAGGAAAAAVLFCTRYPSACAAAAGSLYCLINPEACTPKNCPINSSPSDDPYYSQRPPGSWPADSGAREWDKRNGGGRKGRDKFHDTKQNSPWPGGKEDWSVDPSTGDIYDPNGDPYDNLND